MTAICFDSFNSSFDSGSLAVAWPQPNRTSKVVSNFIFDDAIPLWKKSAVAKLKELSQLQAGWDSYGAKSVISEYLTSAMALLSEIMREDTPAPWIVPTPDGRIQIEWHEHGIDLEIELIDASNFSVGYEDTRTGVDEEFDVASDLSHLYSILEELTSRAALN